MSIIISKKKYKLGKPVELIPKSPYWGSNDTRTYFRIKALRDIPAFNVKKGDLGGYVTSAKVLSHEGNCWIGYGASVMGHVTISDDAYIGDEVNILCGFSDSSIAIDGHAKILNNVHVSISSFNKKEPCQQMRITDHVIISDQARLANVTLISGKARISGRALITRAKRISGNSIICDDAVINKDVSLCDVTVSGHAQIGEGESFSSGVFCDTAIYVNEKKELKTISIGENNNKKEDSGEATPQQEKGTPNQLKMLARVNHFNQVKAKIEAYESDIVKIIKYPLMTDKANDYTRDMAIAFNKAERLLPDVDKEFEDAVSELEAKFLLAESNAIKVSSSQLTVSELKKVSTAKDMFSIAGNDASTENERKTAFVQGFKQLEGILTVPENAIDAFRIKIGMKELGA